MADYILTIDNQFSVEFSWYMNNIVGGNPHVVHWPAGSLAPGNQTA
jgi:hypothetical protein